MTTRRIINFDGEEQAALRTYVCFILDRSGSMDARKVQVLSGYKEYLAGLRKQPDVFFSLTMFSTDCLPVHVAIPVAGVPDLTEQTYVPGGMTALYDSVLDTVGLLKQELPSDGGYRVLVVVMTDGEENASQRATKVQVAELITQQEALGTWTFVYLGAGRDAWAEAAMMGVSKGNTMAYVAGNTVGAFTELSHATACYARSAAAGTQAFYRDAGQTADQYGGKVAPGTLTAIDALKKLKEKGNAK